MSTQIRRDLSAGITAPVTNHIVLDNALKEIPLDNVTDQGESMGEDTAQEDEVYHNDIIIPNRPLIGRGTKMMIVAVLFAVACVVCCPFSKAQLGSKLTQDASVVCAETAERLANVIKTCALNESFLIEPYADIVVELRVAVACSEKVADLGNSVSHPVTVHGRNYKCPLLYNPADPFVQGEISGRKDLVDYVSSNSRAMTKEALNARMRSTRFDTSTIGSHIAAKKAMIAELEDKIARLNNGERDPLCSSRSYREMYEEFMCSHVLRAQLPRTPSCYDPKDPDFLHPGLYEKFEAFERGNTSMLAGHAKTWVFEKCAKLLGPLFAYDMQSAEVFRYLVQERQKRISDDAKKITKTDFCKTE